MANDGRLDTLAPTFVKSLQSASPAIRRAISLAACEHALAYTRVESALVEPALHCLRMRFTLENAALHDLQILRDRFDGQYFERQSVVESGSCDRSESDAAFSKARAIAALIEVSRDNSLASASEAIYEAAFAVTNQREFLDRLQIMLAEMQNEK